MPRLRHAPSSPLLICPTSCLCCRSARGVICFLSTKEQGARGELEVDRRCFFFAATAVLRDRSSFGGDRDGDRRLLDTVWRSGDGRNGGFDFLFVAAATVVASMALMALALMASMAVVVSTFSCLALATMFFLLFETLQL